MHNEGRQEGSDSCTAAGYRTENNHQIGFEGTPTHPRFQRTPPHTHPSPSRLHLCQPCPLNCRFHASRRCWKTPRLPPVCPCVCDVGLGGGLIYESVNARWSQTHTLRCLISVFPTFGTLGKGRLGTRPYRRYRPTMNTFF